LLVGCKANQLALWKNACAIPAQRSFREFNTEFVQFNGFAMLVISYIIDSMSIIKFGFSAHSFIQFNSIDL
jgi:hypothetical protein